MHIVHDFIPESWLPLFQHKCGKNDLGDNNIQLDNRMRMMTSNYLRETYNCLNYLDRAISLNFPDESCHGFFSEFTVPQPVLSQMVDFPYIC